MAQQVKDQALPLLWGGLAPQPGNLHIPQVQPKKKKDRKKEFNHRLDTIGISICNSYIMGALLAFRG